MISTPLLLFTRYWHFALLIVVLLILVASPNSKFRSQAPSVNVLQLKSIGLYPFIYPVMTPRISSSYGMRKHPLLKFSRTHQGTDLAAEIGAPIRAVGPGRVVFADPYAGYGNLVVIEHQRGITTHYGHCDQIKIKPGQTVKAGDIIATIGTTGLSSGPHLHFEIRIGGEAKNPEEIIPDLATVASG